jgi:hypothetical protein
MNRSPRVSAVIACAIASAAASAHADDDWVSRWLDGATASQAEQPSWVTPLVTVTPRLEQEYRFDFVRQQAANGYHVDNFGNGKGLELIPSENTEIVINVPPYIDRTQPGAKSGWGDLSFLLKYRLLSANAQNGDYIVTAFVGTGFATGEKPNGGIADTVNAAIAAGKGWGDFDVQSTLGVTVPRDNFSEVGRTWQWNTAFQYRLPFRLWPEIEYNWTRFDGGPHDGRSQAFVTLGAVLGKIPLHDRIGLTLGVGFQHAVSQFHTYNNALVMTGRMPF